MHHRSSSVVHYVEHEKPKSCVCVCSCWRKWTKTVKTTAQHQQTKCKQKELECECFHASASFSALIIRARSTATLQTCISFVLTWWNVILLKLFYIHGFKVSQHRKLREGCLRSASLRQEHILTFRRAFRSRRVLRRESLKHRLRGSLLTEHSSLLVFIYPFKRAVRLPFICFVNERCGMCQICFCVSVYISRWTITTHTHTEGKQGVVQESKHSAINRRWSIYISGLSSVVRTLGLFAAVNLQSESTILTKLNATFERPLLPLLSDFQTQKTRFIFRLEENLLLRELKGCKTVVGLDLSLPGAAGPGRTDCPTANPEQLLQADRSRFQTTESFKVSPSHGRPRCFNDLVRDSSLFT